jgi:hypothetical protein
MKADQIGSDNTFTTSASIFFCQTWSGADITQRGYGCGFFRISDMVRSRVVVGAVAD